MMQYMLDTNTCIDIMRNVESVVAKIIQVSPQQCYLSTITTFELLTGIQKCSSPTQELPKLEKFLAMVTILGFDQADADCCAKIRVTLESQGLKIGPYDLLIAGQAFSNQMTLVTSNVREFSRISDLVWENWR